MPSPFVRNIRQVWLLYQEAITWGSTPAAYFGVDDEYVAYCFNQAVTYVGKFIEGKMDEASAKAKSEKASVAARQRILTKYLSMDGKRKKPQFMDPAQFLMS